MSSESPTPELTVALAPPVHPAAAATRELEFCFFIEADNPQTINFDLSGENGSFNLVCVHDPARALLCLHGVDPRRVRPAAIPETTRLMNHLSRPLPGGNFRSALQLFRAALDQALTSITQVAHLHTTAAAALADCTPQPASN
jgi:hypothetical protein